MNRFTAKINKRFALLIVAMLFSVSHVVSITTPAIARGFDEQFYSNNNILFFDPRSGVCGPGSGGTTANMLAGDSIEEKVWNFFAGKGLTAEQTAGIMGNISHESGFNPAAIEGGNSIGFGIVQWSFGRRTALEQAAAQAGQDPKDLGFQLEYLFMELNTRSVDYSKYINKGYQNEWDGISKQATVEDAVVFFHHEFEISYLINFDSPGYVSSFHNRTYPSADAAVIGERGGVKGPTGHPGAQYYFDTYSGMVASAGKCGGGAAAEIEFDMSKLFESSVDITCAPGTNDAGIDTAYNSGQPFEIRLCEIPNSIESGKGRGGLVNARVSAAALAMFEKMKTDLGISTVPLNDSFRTYAEQVEAKRVYGNQAASPGYSRHQSGLAFDFGEGGCSYSLGVGSCSNSRIWRWMMDNAASFQYQQFSQEWWHWSPDGR